MGTRYTQNNFYITDDEALDSRQGPFNSVSEALDFIKHRYQGLVVYIISGSTTVEYWFKDGIDDSDLVIKAGAGGGDMYTSVYDQDVDGVVDSSETTQIIVRNSTGSTLAKGKVVYLSGATGNRPNAVLSSATTEATSSKTIGIVIADIPNNSDGYVAVNGTLHNLDLSAFTAGDNLWLSNTAGDYVANTPPAEPSHAVFIGVVARAHPTQGRMVIAIQNGYELTELHGVIITSAATNDFLYYASDGLWKNKQLGLSDMPSGVITTSTTTIAGDKTFSGKTSFSDSITVTPPTGSGADKVGVIVAGSNTNGGTSYVDFLKATNLASGATNINKYFRLNSTGGIEIINSAYTANLLTLTDAGVLTTAGSVNGATPTEMGYLSGVTSALSNAPIVLYRLPSAVNIGNSTTTVVTTITTFDITGLSIGTTLIADAIFSSTSNANTKTYQISLSAAGTHPTVATTTGGIRIQLVMRVHASNTIRMSLLNGFISTAVNPSYVDVTGTSNVFTLQIRCTVNGTGGGVPVNTVENLTLTRF